MACRCPAGICCATPGGGLVKRWHKPIKADAGVFRLQPGETGAAQEFGSRAVQRIEVRDGRSVGVDVACPGCGRLIRFETVARRMVRRVVHANVYDADRWVRAEAWHPACYEAAGEPYGAVDESSSAVSRPGPPMGGATGG